MLLVWSNFPFPSSNYLYIFTLDNSNHNVVRFENCKVQSTSTLVLYLFYCFTLFCFTSRHVTLWFLNYFIVPFSIDFIIEFDWNLYWMNRKKKEYRTTGNTFFFLLLVLCFQIPFSISRKGSSFRESACCSFVFLTLFVWHNVVSC